MLGCGPFYPSKLTFYPMEGTFYTDGVRHHTPMFSSPQPSYDYLELLSYRWNKKKSPFHHPPTSWTKTQVTQTENAILAFHRGPLPRGRLKEPLFEEAPPDTGPCNGILWWGFLPVGVNVEEFIWLEFIWFDESFLYLPLDCGVQDLWLEEGPLWGGSSLINHFR